MNAPVKISLADLHAQRKAIIAKQRDLAASYGKLAEIDSEVETVAAEINDFDNKAADAVEVWSSGGCKGQRPRADLDRRHELERRQTELLHQQGHTGTAKAALAVRGTELAQSFAENHHALEDAAALTMANEATWLAASVSARHRELHDDEQRLLATRDYFRHETERFSQTNPSPGGYPVWRPAFAAAMGAAASGLVGALSPAEAAAGTGGLSPLMLSSADPKLKQEVERRFWQLVTGE